MSQNTKKLKKIFICTLCGKTFSKQCNLSRHIRNIHKSSEGGRKCTLICPLCSETFWKYTELDAHLKNAHSIKITEEQMIFDSKEHFQNWKQKLETDTQSGFRMSRSLSSKDFRLTDYLCHRSGKAVYSKIINRQRATKGKGPNGINCNCPARIITKQMADGSITVHFFGTHVGHTQDVGRLRLSHAERATIAAKLCQGIPPQQILKDIGDEFNPSKRISYTTLRDIHNIKHSFNVSSDIIFDKDDAESVDVLINQLNPLIEDSDENPILAYKPYGVEDLEIGTNNFFLIFMNQAQRELLNIYGNDILMIDSTHGTNPYKIQLTTLMVVDRRFEGFPVAFLWSITQTKKMFEHFFTAIKKIVPDIKPRYFMSVDTNTFYNAFVSVYGHIPSKLLCDWHTKKKLFENLTKISSAEKKEETKASLKSIINEVDVVTFETTLPTFTENLIKDPETEKYGTYFSKYANRPEQWALCFKKEFHRNTNLALENWHQELKHNASVGGKCQQRLDCSIQNVLECLRQKCLKLLIYVSHNEVPHKLYALRKRHELACLVLNQTDLQRESASTFLVTSKNKDTDPLLEFFKVTVVAQPEQCKCEFLCTECRKCLHMLSCTCHDYSVHYNMCKHIHLVCLKYFPMHDDIQPIRTFTDQNILDDQNYEHNTISNHLHSRKTITSSSELETLKRAAIENFHDLVSEISSVEAVSYLLTYLNTVRSEIHALQNNSVDNMVPEKSNNDNKNAEHQKRYLCKLKKNKRKRCPVPENNDCISNLLT
uniref:C2H2-type domain-containing protein n=2 Tax=Photinus pyralis TaxID=7054 RepID=A0A1Y1N7T3_PHOPY